MSRLAAGPVVATALGVVPAGVTIAQELPYYSLGELVVSIRRPVIEAPGRFTVVCPVGQRT